MYPLLHHPHLLAIRFEVLKNLVYMYHLKLHLYESINPDYWYGGYMKIVPQSKHNLFYIYPNTHWFYHKKRPHCDLHRRSLSHSIHHHSTFYGYLQILLFFQLVRRHIFKLRITLDYPCAWQIACKK